MDHNVHKAKAKTMDVAAPKSARSAAPLVIPTRTAIKDESINESVTDASEPAQSAAAPPQPHKTIVPVAASTSETTSKQSPAVEPTKQASTEPASADPPNDKPNDLAAPAAPATDIEDSPAAADQNSTPPDDAKLADPHTINTKTPTQTDELNKAVERERQLQEYINNRKYFVPIRTAARERSIQRSIFLTLIVLLLAGVLIDLMLDTGIILLIQKIPHTHFFNLGG